MNVNPSEFVVILNNLIFQTTTISFNFNYHYFRLIKHIVSLDTQMLMGFQVPCELRVYIFIHVNCPMRYQFPERYV